MMMMEVKRPMGGMKNLVLYSLPSEDEERRGGDEVNKFFAMMETPDMFGNKIDYPIHDQLTIGKNVEVYVPSAVTQKLKITVLEDVNGKEKKCSPRIELPKSEVRELSNNSEYQNVRLLLLVQAQGKNFSFPIEGCMGQRGTTKEEERTIHQYKDSKVIFFSRAKMPNAPIKKRLKKMGVNHMSFMFLVNGKVVRDNCKRKVVITTENSLGTEKCYEVNKEAYNNFTNGTTSPNVDLPLVPSLHHDDDDFFFDDNGNNDDESIRKDNVEERNDDEIKRHEIEDVSDKAVTPGVPFLYIVEENNTTTNTNTNNNPNYNNNTNNDDNTNNESTPNRKRKVDDVLREQIGTLMQDEVNEDYMKYMSQSFNEQQLGIIANMLDCFVQQKKKREDVEVNSWLNFTF